MRRPCRGPHQSPFMVYISSLHSDGGGDSLPVRHIDQGLEDIGYHLDKGY